MNNIDDDCNVITEMPLSDEVVGFIEKGLQREMTDEDVVEWCDDNLDDLASIYEKYRGTYASYRDAEQTLFFTRLIFTEGYRRDDAYEMIGSFVDFQ